MGEDEGQPVVSGAERVELTVRGRGNRRYVAGTEMLVARQGKSVPQWLPVEYIEVGDYVGLQYGGAWALGPARTPVLPPRARYGSEKAVPLPATMTRELAFLLGAYFSEGHTTRSNWSVILTNSVVPVLERCQRGWASEFGLHSRITRQPGRCTGLVVSSKRLVEFLDVLGIGARASHKRVPDAIMNGSRDHALAFMQGAALDAYTVTKPAAKWAICLESPGAINDLQDLVTRLGVGNAQITKYNRTYDKTYFELYAPGAQGQVLCTLFPFLEPDKAARAEAYRALSFGAGTADLIPGVSGRALYESIPRGRTGRYGKGTGRQQFRHLRDVRSERVSRGSILKAREAGAELPSWLAEVLDSDWRFSPVRRIVRRDD